MIRKNIKSYKGVLEWISQQNITEKRKSRKAVEAWKEYWNIAIAESNDPKEKSLMLSLLNSISYRMADGLTWKEFYKIIRKVVDKWE